jgi:hypothetical protein
VYGVFAFSVCFPGFDNAVYESGSYSPLISCFSVHTSSSTATNASCTCFFLSFAPLFSGGIFGTGCVSGYYSGGCACNILVLLLNRNLITGHAHVSSHGYVDLTLYWMPCSVGHGVIGTGTGQTPPGIRPRELDNDRRVCICRAGSDGNFVGRRPGVAAEFKLSSDMR